MSWGNFKTIMKSYMGNQNGIKSKEDFAKQFTEAYDLAVKSGTVIIKGLGGVNITATQGQKDLMEKLMIAAGAISLTKTETGQHQYLKLVGQAITAYWGGAQLAQIPPTIPPPGAYQNLLTTTGVASNPGQWPDTPPEFPTDDTDMFLNMFISYASAHLSTVEFSINTTSLYFGFPLIPALPGLVQTKGYLIPQ